ncbi:MAG: SRPBCC domain-containing protein [Gemmatimonadota bacterium]
MTVTLEKSFRIDRDRDEVWRFLTNPANVAACLPGARLVQVLDERTFEGEVRLRLGPFGLVFRGLARFTELDPDEWHARLEASASELKGWGTGQMWMRSRLLPEQGATRVELEQSFQVSGRLSGVVATGLLRRAADFVMTRFAFSVRSKIENEEG